MWGKDPMAGGFSGMAGDGDGRAGGWRGGGAPRRCSRAVGDAQRVGLAAGASQGHPSEAELVRWRSALVDPATGAAGDGAGRRGGGVPCRTRRRSRRRPMGELEKRWGGDRGGWSARWRSGWDGGGAAVEGESRTTQDESGRGRRRRAGVDDYYPGGWVRTWARGGS